MREATTTVWPIGPQNGEGTWINNDNIGSIILCGRSGVAGDSFAMVLGGPQQGDLVSSIVFSCDTPTSVITSYTMVLAVYDSSGTLVQNLSTVQGFTFDSTSRTTSVSLNMADSPLTWGEGYKLVAGVRGGAGSATSPYTLTNIQVAYEVVPGTGHRLSGPAWSGSIGYPASSGPVSSKRAHREKLVRKPSLFPLPVRERLSFGTERDLLKAARFPG